MQDETIVTNRIFVPTWEKSNLTLAEASEYFGIGINKLRELTDLSPCPYVLRIGTKRLIKKDAFKKFLEKEEVL